MPTYKQAWDADTDKAKAAREKYGTFEAFETAAKAWNAKQKSSNPTKTSNNDRIQNVVDKTNIRAKGGAGALPTSGAVMHKDKSGNVITNQSLPGSGSRATIEKAGTKGAKKAENSEIRSSSSNPDTKYGKYAKSMEGTGKTTHGSIGVAYGNKSLNTGMGYTKEAGKSGKNPDGSSDGTRSKTKVYSTEGKKVAVIKKDKVKGGETKRKGSVRLTRAGRKDADTTLTKTKKSGKTKVKGAVKTKKDSARTVANKALGVGTKNPDGSPKEVKRSAIRKKAGEVRRKRAKTRAHDYS